MKKLLVTSLALGMSLTSHATSIEDIGDITQAITPIVGLGMTFYYDDTEGTWQFAKSYIASQATTQMTKRIANKRRPNFKVGTTNGASYPSGHTSSAFSGAAFIYNRYGATLGVPAYGIAAFTGYSRVHADKHYIEDVVAGASIAVLTSLYFVNAADDQVAFVPKTDGESMGVDVIFSSDFFSSKAPTTKPNGEPFDGKHAFEFFTDFTQFSSSDADHPIFGLAIDENNKRNASSHVQWLTQYNKKHSFVFSWNPYETRSSGQYQGDVAYARYMLNDVKIGWNYHVNLADNVIAKAGAAVISQFSEAEIYEYPYDETTLHDGSKSKKTLQETQEWTFYPAVTATLGYEFSPKIAVEMEGMYANNGDGTIQALDAEIAYRFDVRWDMGIGYSFYQRDNEKSDAYNNVQFDAYFLKFGYRF